MAGAISRGAAKRPDSYDRNVESLNRRGRGERGGELFAPTDAKGADETLAGEFVNDLGMLREVEHPEVVHFKKTRCASKNRWEPSVARCAAKSWSGRSLRAPRALRFNDSTLRSYEPE